MPVRELILPTQDEIVARFHERKEGDPFGFEVGEYVNCLDYVHAKPFIKDTVTESEWQGARTEHSTRSILKVMEDYQPFAWEKANECRGLSANRSILHYIAWIWLLGDMAFLKEIEGMYLNYHFYGKPILERIAERYEWDWKQFDNGQRQDTEE